MEPQDLGANGGAGEERSLSVTSDIPMRTQGEEIWGDDELTAAHVVFGASEGHPRGLEQQLRPQMACSAGRSRQESAGTLRSCCAGRGPQL